jgi:hypothetical protein
MFMARETADKAHIGKTIKIETVLKNIKQSESILFLSTWIHAKRIEESPANVKVMAIKAGISILSVSIYNLALRHCL